MCADECSKHGIILESLNEQAYARIDQLLPSYWSKGNPIDTVASLNLTDVQEIIKAIFEEIPNVEAVLLLGVGGFSYLANLAKQSPLIPEEKKVQLDFIEDIEINLWLFHNFQHHINTRTTNIEYHVRILAHFDDPLSS